MSALHTGEIIFDAAKHEYSIDGVTRPSVTQIIGVAGLIDSDWFTEESRLRGQAVHAACHYFDDQDLDEDWLASSPWTGYVAAWEKFRRDTGFVAEQIEHRAYNPVFGYCGTPDRVGRIGSRKFVLDIKTGGPERWHEIQLAAYCGLLQDKPMTLHRARVRLAADGSYDAAYYDPSTHMESWQDFAACLRIWNLRNRRITNGSRSSRTAA